ncbi:MAG: cupin domain-containing protein [Deltaproteobacteria bacterium]|nr:cupin domain-containing protein [Deltaproteobacteria bacterium]MBW1956288.1 cupin domain-containing protein [Deltaproteobacteria bacterium]MBW2042204.1 cupin domain-containing protein [Deltaproteobacteria bacterium]MBW2133499.1 cupin domain-containing protein [Deltaproteobacteria bacterium]
MEKKDANAQSHMDFFKDLTGEIAGDTPREVEEIGSRIRTLRQEKGLSLEELSRITGYDTAFLAQIESDQLQPQLGTLIKLSKALDSAFGRLVSGVGSRLYSITRKDEQKIVSRSTSQKGKKKVYTYKSLAPEVKGRHMEALIVELEENPEEETSVHEGEEFIHVLDGTVLLKIAGDAFELNPGDSAYYLSTTPHFIGAKKERATILAVLYGG